MNFQKDKTSYLLSNSLPQGEILYVIETDLNVPYLNEQIYDMLKWEQATALHLEISNN